MPVSFARPLLVLAGLVAAGSLAGCGDDTAAASPLEQCIADAAEVLNDLEVGADGTFVDAEALVMPGTDPEADDDCDSEYQSSGLSDAEILDRIVQQLDDEHREAFEALQSP